MKKIGIVTIYDETNYGNRLQNYATQEVIKKLKLDAETILNLPALNNKENKYKHLLKIVKLDFYNFRKNIKNRLKPKRRENKFKQFNKNMKFSKKYFNFLKFKDYDYYIVGSDQVWNPTFKRLSEFDLVMFTKSKNKIAFSASFGISKLPKENKEKAKSGLKEFKAISVREDAGQNIVKELVQRQDVEVLVDPTMLLTSEEWDKVSKKPEQLKTDRYILNYFLGELSETRKNEINRIAKQNNCEIINILDKESPFYQTGPAEFLYLEKHAFLICTDSFHSSVFAILYNRPFIVFDREDNTAKMNSRIETLISKFNLKNREFAGSITKENLENDYTETYKILEKEREKSLRFLHKALDIE